MAEASEPGDVHIGTLGELQLDVSRPSQFSWSGQRQSLPVKPIQAISVSRIPSSADPDSRFGTSSLKIRDSGDVAHRLQRLVKCLPELSAAIRNIHGTYFEQFRGEGLPGAAIYRGQMLTFGNMIAIDDSARPMSRFPLLPFVAHVSGTFRNEVRVRELEDARFGWDAGASNDRDAWVEARTVAEDDYASWTNATGELLQITSSAFDESAPSLLLLRSSSNVCVLQPQYRSRQSSYSAGLNYTRDILIGLNHLLDFSAHHFGMRGFADANFCPWDRYRLAAIDAHGQWRVWKLAKEPGSSGLIPRVSNSGNLEDDEDLEQTHETGSEDACRHRIAWVGSSRTLLVCSIRDLRIYKLGKQNATSQDTIQVIKFSGAEIIELKVSLQAHRAFQVVTGSHIETYVMRETLKRDMKAYLEFSCRHGRDTSDGSLNLREVHGETEHLFLLHSQRSCLITLHEFSNDQGTANGVVRDTIYIKHGLDMERGDAPTKFLDVAIFDAQLNMRKMDSFGPAKRYSEHGLKFFQMFALAENLELEVVLLAGDATETDSTISVAPPTWWTSTTRARVSKRVPRSGREQSRTTETDGVSKPSASDTDMDTDANDLSSSAEDVGGLGWTVANEIVFDEISRKRDRNDKLPIPALENFEERLRTVHERDHLSKSSKMQLFSDLGKIRIPRDNEKVAEAIDRVFSQQDTNHYMTSNVVTSLSGTEGSDASGSTLSQLHRTILRNWIDPVERGVSDAERERQMERAQQFGFKVFCNSVAIPTEAAGAQSGPSETTPGPTDSSQIHALGLPIIMEGAEGDEDSLEPEVKAIDTSFVNDAAQRLARFTEIEAGPVAISKEVHGILAHRAACSDPSKYDFEEVKAQLSGIKRIEGSGATAEQQKRKWRKRVAREMKRVRLNRRAPESQMATQRAWNSSQQAAESAAVASIEVPAMASQIEAGRYGGRSWLAAGKSKGSRPARRAGF